MWPGIAGKYYLVLFKTFLLESKCKKDNSSRDPLLYTCFVIEAKFNFAHREDPTEEAAAVIVSCFLVFFLLSRGHKSCCHI
jgi:hypothetical protein